jgi:hypothetical protein
MPGAVALPDGMLPFLRQDAKIGREYPQQRETRCQGCVVKVTPDYGFGPGCGTSIGVADQPASWRRSHRGTIR